MTSHFDHVRVDARLILYCYFVDFSSGNRCCNVAIKTGTHQLKINVLKTVPIRFHSLTSADGEIPTIKSGSWANGLTDCRFHIYPLVSSFDFIFVFKFFLADRDLH